MGLEPPPEDTNRVELGARRMRADGRGRRRTMSEQVLPSVIDLDNTVTEAEPPPTCRWFGLMPLSATPTRTLEIMMRSSDELCVTVSDYKNGLPVIILEDYGPASVIPIKSRIHYFSLGNIGELFNAARFCKPNLHRISP